MAVISGKNLMALISYCLGILSLLPMRGFFFAIPAIFFGIKVIIAEKKNPEIEGLGHAWFGTIMGIISGLIYFVLIAYFFDRSIFIEKIIQNKTD